MLLQKSKISGFADEIHKELDVQIQILQKLGQKYIEFRSADGLGVADYSIEQIREVKRKLDASGIKVSALGSPIGKIPITNPFEPHFELFKHVVSLAKELDTRYIRMFSFFIPSDENADQYQGEVFKRMRQMVEYAKEQDVVLLHENEKEIYGDSKDRCRNLMEEFYCENFKCIFDFANFIQCGEDTLKAYEMLKSYITYVHVKDAKQSDGEVVLPGHGDGNLSKIFAALEKEGYQGFLSLEPHLVDFSQLKNLENAVVKKKMSDGATAYEMAYKELIKLLS